MSSASVKEGTAAGTETKPKAALAPVPVIDSPLSKSVALSRPVLLLGLVALGFDALVAEPVTTLQLALPAVAFIQTAYAIICLPVAGSQTAKVIRKPRPGEKKKADSTGANTISVRERVLWFEI
jgi:phosphatidylinositol glycan class F